MPRIPCWLLAMMLIGSAGCSNVGQGKLINQTLHPGPWQYQTKQATQFDPYPEQSLSMGPKDSTNRPRDYAEPIPEASRGRWIVTQPGQDSTANRW
ncbi:MAG TPA: hypothetical protein VHC22_25835 [Pirellulales bacterium]|nr:hypothetical protein [Pirellulales bacterium]